MEHDPHKPFHHWYQRTPDGLTLFVVFYSMACRYGKCAGCNLHRQMAAEHVDFRCLMAQVDYLFQMPDVAAQTERIRKLIVSNNGSVFDERTFSSTALIYLVAMVNMHLPSLATLSIESRPEHVDACELEFLSRALHEGSARTLEIAVGFEAFDDDLRNRHFRKGLSREAFEAFVRKVAAYRHTAIKTYFMLKPVPEMTAEQAIDDIAQAIRYLSQLSRRYNVPFNLHLNPTYVAAGTELEKAFREKRYEPPTLRDVARAVLPALGEPISVYLGLYDEGLAVEGGSFLRPGDEAARKTLEQFNSSQDYSLVKIVAQTKPESTRGA